MTNGEQRQRLAAILAADAAGFSRLMERDEHATLEALEAARTVFRQKVESNQGRVIDTAGDSVLAVFDSAAGAVTAAQAIQLVLERSAHDVADERRLRFRIGVHLGDVIEKAEGAVYGDGVNIAARLQGLAAPGGIVVSEAVRGAVKNRVSARFDDLGVQAVKNIADPVRAFAVAALGSGKAAPPSGSAARKPASSVRLPTRRMRPSSMAMAPLVTMPSGSPARPSMVAILQSTRRRSHMAAGIKRGRC